MIKLENFTIGSDSDCSVEDCTQHVHTRSRLTVEALTHGGANLIEFLRNCHTYEVKKLGWTVFEDGTLICPRHGRPIP